MLLDRNLSQYVVGMEESIGGAVRHVVDRRGRIAVVTDGNGVFQGLLTNGDILRWLSEHPSGDTSQPVTTLLRPRHEYLTVEAQAASQHISSLLEQVRFVPVLDDRGRLTAVARERTSDDRIHIGPHVISDDAPVFVIAEIGLNHNGCFDRALELVDAAAATGADCAKFQMRDLATLYVNAGDSADPKENLGSQYTLDLLNRFQLSTEQMFALFDRCRERGMIPLCTPWDPASLDVLQEYGMSAWKLASADLTNHQLLHRIAESGEPLLCSTGMSTEEEIESAVALMNRSGAAYVLLHCNSTYPAPYKDLNLQYLPRLQEIGKCPVGYSGHERGWHATLAAVALGARVVEKHITLDRSLEGNDHKVSLLPDEFRLMVQQIRDVEQSLGTRTERRVSQGELMNRVTLAKSLVATRDLPEGTIVDESMVSIKSPGRGLQPNRLPELLGTTLSRAVQGSECFFPSDLAVQSVAPRPYQFRRPWGVPVRYHDFQEILQKSGPDFLEFHLSYRDMDLDLHSFFETPLECGLVVHSPDTFSGDHLLNLCDADADYRRRSIQELQRVVQVTRDLQIWFPKTVKPLVVASVGGYTQHGHVTPSERQRMYELVQQSLSQIDSDGVEIIPQTLPPFPWYFGGQQYLNLFMDPADTAEYCRQTGDRICLDVCHSRLACNHFGWSFQEFVSTVGPHVAHLHICDAAGVDGEGLQVGDGEIDFPALAADLDRVAPGVSFIPEIWQGHENAGEGFWIALDRMEGVF